MYKKLIFVLIIIFIGIITVFILGNVNGDSVDEKEIFEKLQTAKSDREMLHAYKKYQEMRKKLGDSLVEKVRKRSGKFGPVSEAGISTRCLGEMRYAPAAEILAEALAEEGDGFEIHDNIVSKALVKIGLPAVPELIKKIKKPDSSIQQTRSVEILVKIYGEKIALILMQEVLDQEQDEKNQRAIKELIKVIIKKESTVRKH